MSPFRGSVSVDHAVKVGLRWINVPVFLIMIGGAAAGLWLIVRYGSFINSSSPLALLPPLACFVIPWSAAWLWWSFNIARWRLWALERVEDWPRLHAAAVDAKLIWAEVTPLERLFARTELWSDEQKRRLETLRAERGETSL